MKLHKMVCIGVFLLVFSLNVSARADNDDQWQEMGLYPGLVGVTINAIAASTNDMVYVAGNFTNAGGIAVNNIVMWDGTAWHPVGSGIGTGLESRVHALALGPDGALYAGGQFRSAGDVTATNVARWDGVSWTNLGSGVGSFNPGYTHGVVHALAVDSVGNVYAGGDTASYSFDVTNREHVFRWNGSSWTNLGSGILERSGFTYEIRSLSITGSGPLYIGGSFTNIGGQTAHNIARWNGATWSGVGSSGTSSRVDAMVQDRQGNLYIGGLFQVVGDVAASFVAKWNGSSWFAMGSGFNSAVSTLAVETNGTVYASGGFLTSGSIETRRIARWLPGASAWTNLPGSSGGMYAMAPALGGGVYSSLQVLSTNLNSGWMNYWNGSRWITFGNGLNDVVYGMTTASNGDVYAVGDFVTAGGNGAARVARWNGVTWTNMGAGFGNRVSAIVNDGNGHVYVGGQFTNTGAVALNRVARWNGTAWEPLGDGLGPNVNALLCDGPNSLYVGGSFTNAGSVAARRIAHWNGSVWTNLGEGMDGTVFALAMGTNGMLYAGGSFNTAGGLASKFIAVWNGTTWTNLGTGTTVGSSGVLSLSIDSSGRLVAGGAFTMMRDVAATNIALWDGSTWQSFGHSFGSVRALCSDGFGNVYAGGNFITIGGTNVQRIARWNGTAWTDLGSGVNNNVEALAFHPLGKLYVGGSFLQAGGKPASYSAMFSVPVNPEISVNGTNGIEISSGNYTPATTEGTDFGSAFVASSTVTRIFSVINSGASALNVSEVTFSGSDFAINFTPGSIASGTSSNLIINFAPSAEGLRTGVVSIVSNDLDENPYQFGVQGVGVLAPNIAIYGTNGVSIQHGDATPSTDDGTDFGSIDIATGLTIRVYTIENSGTTNLTILSTSVGGSHAAEYIVLEAPPVIDPGASSNLVVQFNPAGTGMRSALITVNSDDPDTAVYTFAVAGRGGGVNMNIRGRVAPDAASHHLVVTYTISNAGPSAAVSTILTSSIPVGATVLGSSSSVGTWVIQGGSAEVQLSSLVSGQVVHASLTFAQPRGHYTISGSVSSQPPDFYPADNEVVLSSEWGWYAVSSNQVLVGERNSFADLEVDRYGSPHVLFTGIGSSGLQDRLRTNHTWQSNPAPPISVEPDSPVAVAYSQSSPYRFFCRLFKCGPCFYQYDSSVYGFSIAGVESNPISGNTKWFSRFV